MRLPGRTGDQPEGGLAVLPAPAAVGTRPVRRHQPQVAAHARREDGGERGHRLQHAREERLTLTGHPVPPVAAVEQVDPAVTQRQVQVLTVSDRPGHDGRSERRLQAVPARHRPHRLPHEQHLVRGAHRVERLGGELELSRGVLRVQLQHVHRLRGERGQHVMAVVRQLDHPGHAVRRAAARRTELPSHVGPHHPLDLEAHPDVEPVVGRLRRGPSREAALTTGMLVAVLGVPVHRRPRPARLRRQAHETVEVRVQPQVAARAHRRAGPT